MGVEETEVGQTVSLKEKHFPAERDFKKQNYKDRKVYDMWAKKTSQLDQGVQVM